MATYLQGLLMGLAYVAPIGMQNMYVINSSLNSDKYHLFATVISIIINDISLALVCFLGIGSILSLFPALKSILAIVGFIAILIISYNIWKSIPAKSSTTSEQNLKKIIVSTIAVTWLNPQAILDGTIILGSMYSVLAANQRLFFIFGFTSASMIWFSGLAFFVKKSSKFISKSNQTLINKISALVLLLFGFRLIASLL